MKTRLAAVLAFLAAIVPVAFAQQGGPPPPAPEMTKWKWMAGIWNVTETHEKSPWSPGGKGRGESVITLGPGGHSMYYDYRSKGPMGAYAGRGVSAWDPNAKVMRSIWTDNMTPGMSQSECREEGKDVVCRSQTVQDGRTVHVRMRSVDPRPSGWTDVMEISNDGKTYQKVMTLEYRPAK